MSGKNMRGGRGRGEGQSIYRKKRVVMVCKKGKAAKEKVLL